MNKIIIETNIVRSRPNLCANLGAKGETIAKASKGTVVIVPITELDTPKLSRIIGTSEPTEVKGARKLALINKIPIKRKSPPLIGRSEERRVGKDCNER